MRPLTFQMDIAPEILEAWGGNGTSAPRVSREMALCIPSIKRIRDLIAGTIGMLEFWELTNPGNKPVSSELLEQPEEDVPRSVTMARTAEDLLFEEIAWWRITKYTAEGWPAHVVRLDPRSVNVQQNGRVYVNSRTGQAQGQAMEWVKDSELIRFDSPNPGMLKYGAGVIRDAAAIAASVSRNVKSPVPMGYLSPREQPGEDPVDPPDTDEIVEQWEDAVARRAVPYLNGAIVFNKIQWTPAELGLNEAKESNILELARLGGVDPEELGVSTTSRTYANSEQRRLDLIDFTIRGYITALQDRLSMLDVTMAGRKVRAQYEGFLRSDTKTRMETYKIGREVGVYNDERIARIEEIPSATPPAPPAPVTPQPSTREASAVASVHAMHTAGSEGGYAVGFSAPTTDPVQLSFQTPETQLLFKTDQQKRTITGLAIPWNKTAYSGGRNWKFLPGSLKWSEDSRVKLDLDHVHGTEFGRGVSFTNNPELGLIASFSVARGQRGDDALGLAADGVYDGLSVWVTFDGEGDGWTDDFDNDLAIVHSATLRKVALTALPAFDDARVVSVAATRKDTHMPCQQCGNEHAPGVACTQGNGGVATLAPPAAPVFNAAEFAKHLTDGMATAITSGIAEAMKNVVQPQRPTVPAGRVEVIREAPVYTMNGNGPSFVRDAWRSRTNQDFEAKERLTKFQAQTMDMCQAAMDNPEFAINTGNASQVVPPGFRPDLYITQLIKGRPLMGGISRGTLSDATPFNIPSFVSSSGATADHVEGVNPTPGTLELGIVTVTPQAISGTYQITREIADSANPAIDAIATQAMAESYSQQTEGKVYTELNGTNGVGGVITSGFVPSGAQASTTTGQGEELIDGIKAAQALYPFRRFSAIDFGYLSQEGTTELSSAKDTTGRPLIPWVGPQNAVGQQRQVGGYPIDGVTWESAWSMSGNAAGDADAIGGNRNDVWGWESPMLMFRFEERNGPALIDLALFGYFAVRVLRPVGLFGVRHTHT